MVAGIKREISLRTITFRTAFGRRMQGFGGFDRVGDPDGVKKKDSAPGTSKKPRAKPLTGAGHRKEPMKRPLRRCQFVLRSVVGCKDSTPLPPHNLLKVED